MQYNVSITRGSDRLAKAMAGNLRSRMAIIVNGRVVLVPVIVDTHFKDDSLIAVNNKK
jgi:hypothetical protein